MLKDESELQPLVGSPENELQPLFGSAQKEVAIGNLLSAGSNIEYGLQTGNLHHLNEKAKSVRVRTKDVRELQARILRAAWFIEDVIRNEVQLRPIVLGSSRTDLTLAYLHRHLFKSLTTICLISLIVLSCLERPRWTYFNEEWEYYPMYFPVDYYLNASVVNLIQGALLAILTVTLSVKVYLLRGRLFSRSEPMELRWPVYIQMGAFVGLWVEHICIISWPTTFGQGSRLGNIFRMTMLCARYPSVYNTWRLIFRLVPRILNVIALLVIFMLFSSWCFWWIFIVAPAGTTREYNIFGTLDSSYYHLLEILTTNNYPDLMMPFYDENSLNTLLFIAFITVGVFLLLNMVIGVVFWHYQRQNNKLKASLEQMSKRNVDVAFSLLDVTGSKAIGVEEMILLLERMDMYRRLGTIQGVRVQKILFRLKPLDSETGVEFIDLNEFHGIIAVLAEEIWNVGPQSPIEVHHPDIYYLPAVQRLVYFVRGKHKPVGLGLGQSRTYTRPFRSATSILTRQQSQEHQQDNVSLEETSNTDPPPMDYAVDLVIFCHLLILIAAVIDSSTLKHAYFYKVAEDVFINLYVAELLVRLLVVGPAYHLRGVANRVDSLLIVAVFLAKNLDVLNTKYLHMLNLPSLEGIRVLQALIALRTVKLLRHLKMAPNFLTLMTSLDAVLDGTSALLVTLLSFVYISASMGVALWGGSVCRKWTTSDGITVCTDDAGIPSDSAFVRNDFFSNNFNDIPSAMTLIFEIFVANNIWDLCDGLAAAAGDTAGVRAYFAWNWGFGVNVLMNIVLSVVINSTLEVYGKKHTGVLQENMPTSNESTMVDSTLKQADPCVYIGSGRQRVGSMGMAIQQSTLAQDLAYQLNSTTPFERQDQEEAFTGADIESGGVGIEAASDQQYATKNRNASLLLKK